MATGVYTGVHVRAGITQVVYISKSVTLRGGYGADFGVWNPISYPTTLDAHGQGRVLVITDTQNVTVTGLHITGGFAQGLVGSTDGSDAGGGVYVRALSVTLAHNHIYSNSVRNEWFPYGYGGSYKLGAVKSPVRSGSLQ